MAKDLIIGGMKNYGWNEVRYWVNSIKASGFKGDIALVATNIDNNTISKLEKEEVRLLLYGQQTPTGFTNPNQNAPHVERFIYIWDYLNKNPNKYRYVVVTDVRDVVFQQDPTLFLSKHLKGNRTIVCASEGLQFKDEPWNNKNLMEALGPIVYEQMKDNLIYNVGTFAGYYEPVKDLVLQLFMNSINRPIPVVDQAVFNFIISHYPFPDVVLKATNSNGWAAQLGATLGAVDAGAGDLGMMIKQNPSKKADYIKAYKDTQPKVEDDLVTNGVKPFFLVHQWDRDLAIKELVEKKYGGGKMEITENFPQSNDGYIVIRTE